MDDGTDFASYADARWPALVRTLVLLGHEPAEADEIAVSALSRCVASFGRVAREGDVDVWIYRTLLAARSDTKVDPAAVPELAAVGPVTVPDLEERRSRLRHLTLDLEALPPLVREATVLAIAADLDDFQVADVLGSEEAQPVGGRSFALDHDALEAIPVRSAPIDEIVGRWHERRRRRTRLVAIGVAAVLVVVAVGTWLGTRPPVDELPTPEVTEQTNPADFAWYANHELHLDEVTVELPQLTSIVEVPDGAVVADREGRVLLVDQAGKVTRLGLTRRASIVVGSDDRGLVAWISAEDGRPELIVHDTVRGRELARHTVLDDAQLVALDGDEVFYLAQNRTWSWAFDTSLEPGTEPGGLVTDIASRVRAAQFSDTSVLVSQPLFDIQITVPGSDPMLSPDGDFLLTRVDYGLPDEVRLYVAASGEEISTGVEREEIAVAASFGDDHTITYVIAHREHRPVGTDFVRLSESGPLLMRTCDLDLLTCETVTQISNNRGQPVLPS